MKSSTVDSQPKTKRKATAKSRARRNPDQLELCERVLEQGDLFRSDPGGKQSPVRLREMKESMEAIDSLFYDAIKARGVRVFDEFLQFCRRFNRFSAFNVMLIEMQRPGATAIGSRDQWRAIDRRIKPGAIPIAILWPFAPVHWVYELSDTYGRDIPQSQSDPFATKGSLPGASWGATVRTAERCGILVEATDKWGGFRAGLAGVLHGTKDGAVVTTAGRRHRWRVLVNAGLPPEGRFATLAHELGHIYCGHLGASPEGLLAKPADSDGVAARNGSGSRRVPCLQASWPRDERRFLLATACDGGKPPRNQQEAHYRRHQSR
jgi:hypothetical protein